MIPLPLHSLRHILRIALPFVYPMRSHCRILILSLVQFSLIDTRPLHGMVDVCQKHGAKLLTYGTLVRPNFFTWTPPFFLLISTGLLLVVLAICRLWSWPEEGGLLIFNLTQPSSAGVSSPMHGWVSRNHSLMTDLSRPRNARSEFNLPLTPDPC